MVQIIINPEAFSTDDGVTLTHVNELCIQPSIEGRCATYYVQHIQICVSINILNYTSTHMLSSI